MSNNRFEKEKIELTPDTGFNLVGIDYFADSENQLYLIEMPMMYFYRSIFSFCITIILYNYIYTR